MENKYSDKELQDELKRLAKQFGEDTVFINEMKKYGKFSPAIYKLRFGSWNNAVTLAGLKPVQKGYYRRMDKLAGVKQKITKRNVPLRLAFSVLIRDKHKCVMCGKSPATDESIVLHIDHIKPLNLGGSNNQWNLWVLCSKCNLSKGAKYESETMWFASTYLTKRLLENDKNISI